MVSIEVDDIVLKQTAFVTLALLLKFQATNLMLGSTRFKSGSRPPEDAALIPSAGPQDFDGTTKLTQRKKKHDGDDNEKAVNKLRTAKATEVRTARIVMNDLENIPLGLIVAWMGVLCCRGGGDDARRTVHSVALWAFCAGRFVHSYAYVYALQPLRAIGFTVGLLGTTVMAGNAVFAVAFL